MKYLKLFEQMDEDEEWWEKESIFDEIKVGDKVKCIRDNDSGYYLKIDKIYVVKEIFTDFRVFLILDEMEGSAFSEVRGAWNINRFQKIK